MPVVFEYKVRDAQGRLLAGSIEAEGVAAAAARLRSMGYLPVQIQPRREEVLKKEIHIPIGRAVKVKDLAVFSRQLATMVSSGLSLLRALTILEEQTENRFLARVVGQVRAEVEKGTALSVALSRHPKVFSNLYVSMVKAGETGGILDSVLQKLAETLEADLSLRQKIKSAMTYPAVVFVLVMVVLAAILLFVVPIFRGLYAELGGTLPLPTRVLLGVSALVTRFWYLWFGAALALGVGMRRYVATSSGRYQLDVLKLRLPIFGKLFQKTALSRFARTLGVLLRSGVPILQALDIVAETVNNGVVSRAVRDVQASVGQGESIAKPMAGHKVFPPMVVQMVAVGEETGAVDSMLEKISHFYDQEVEAAVAALTSLIEPLLIAFMGAVVGGIVVALYMPMFNIINLIR